MSASSIELSENSIADRSAVVTEAELAMIDAHTLITTHSSHPLTLLLRSRHTQFFRHGAGGIGFFRHARGLLAVGGALAAADQRAQLLRAFVDWCQDQGCRPYFMHIPEPDLPILAELGFRLDQLGASYSRRYESDRLDGNAFRQVRRKLNAARRSGVTVERIDNAARLNGLRPKLNEINAQWLKAKRHGHLRYLVGHFDEIRLDDDERLYVAWHDGHLIAYILFSRSFGPDEGWFHNLSRRRTGCVDGAMQMIVSTLMQDTGSGNLHFGFTPMVELQPNSYPGSPPLAWTIAALARRGGVVYPARAQRQYKISWAPETVTREYFAYRGNSLLASLWLLRATNSI